MRCSYRRKIGSDLGNVISRHLPILGSRTSPMQRLEVGHLRAHMTDLHRRACPWPRGNQVSEYLAFGEYDVECDLQLKATRLLRLAHGLLRLRIHWPRRCSTSGFHPALGSSCLYFVRLLVYIIQLSESSCIASQSTAPQSIFPKSNG